MKIWYLCHAIYGDIFPWYFCLSRYSGSIQLIKGTYNLLKACTIRYPPVALRTKNVGELCGEVDSLTCPAAKRSANNLSIASTCSRGSGPCFMTQYFELGFRSISWQVPLSLGNSHRTAFGNTSLKFHDFIVERICSERFPRLGCISLNPSLLIKDTLAH